MTQQWISMLTLVLLNPDIPCLCKQCRSRSVGFWRSQLIWICTVCHQVCEFIANIWIKQSDWLKIRSRRGILIYSAWQGLNIEILVFLWTPVGIGQARVFLSSSLCRHCHDAEDLLKRSIWWQFYDDFLQVSIKFYIVGTHLKGLSKAYVHIFFLVFPENRIWYLPKLSSKCLLQILPRKLSVQKSSDDCLTLVLLNLDIPCLCKQCRSRSVGF